MATQRQLRRKQEVPVVHRESEDGETKFGVRPEGAAGDSFTLRDHEEKDLPPEADIMESRTASNRSLTAEEALMENSGVSPITIAAMEAQGRPLTIGGRPPQLPPNVAKAETQYGTSYTFVTPRRGLDVGFQPSVALGTDDGSGAAMPAIVQKAWDLLSEMEKLIQHQDALLTKDQPTHGHHRPREEDVDEDLNAGHVAAAAAISDIPDHNQDQTPGGERWQDTQNRIGDQHDAGSGHIYGVAQRGTELTPDAMGGEVHEIETAFHDTAEEPGERILANSKGVAETTAKASDVLPVVPATTTPSSRQTSEALERARLEAGTAKEEGPETPAPK